MRTAIYVYQPTSINISTSEGDLQLCCMNTDIVPLSAGLTVLSVAPGIYKIVSCHDVEVTGDSSVFDVEITRDNKTNGPPLSPRAAESFAPIDLAALQAFFVVPDAKDLANP